MGVYSCFYQLKDELLEFAKDQFGEGTSRVNSNFLDLVSENVINKIYLGKSDRALLPLLSDGKMGRELNESLGAMALYGRHLYVGELFYLSNQDIRKVYNHLVSKNYGIQSQFFANYQKLKFIENPKLKEQYHIRFDHPTFELSKILTELEVRIESGEFDGFKMMKMLQEGSVDSLDVFFLEFLDVHKSYLELENFYKKCLGDQDCWVLQTFL